jgi:hypothetical protein
MNPIQYGPKYGRPGSGVRPYKMVPPYSVILPWFGRLTPTLAQNNCCKKEKILLQQLLMNNNINYNQDQVLRPILSVHASHCWALTPSWCSPNPASGSFREDLCSVNTWEEHAGGKNGRFWGGEAFLRPFLHWQCQLGAVPYTIQ